ncbi:MAG: hypothetical protein JWQ10_1768 [Herbaspirillum sp.]|nr:hypothetical protein [Herbaspirillum sp.]
MFAVTITGHSSPIQKPVSNNPLNNSPNNSAKNVSKGRSLRPLPRNTPQDVMASLLALRKRFPAAAHIDSMVREQQRSMRERAMPLVRQHPLAEAALGLLAGGANFAARWLNASISMPVTSAARSRASFMPITPIQPVIENGAATPPHAARRRPIRAADAFSAPAMQAFLPDRVLSSQWMAELDFERFDDVAFLRACGETVDDPASQQERLAAVHRCLQPVFSAARPALSIEGMDGSNLSIFFERLLPALGLGEAPAQGLDPAFAQALLNRWFLSMALPSHSYGDAGNPGFPLNSVLLDLTHATPDDAAHRLGLPQIRLNDLRDALKAAFLQDVPPRFQAMQQWAADAFFSLYEPTLTRPDTPPALRYGSLEWALLDIGIRLAGAQQWTYTHAELIGLAAAADVFGAVSDGSSDSLSAADALALGSLLRMAHAQNAIDLRAAETAADASIQIAVALFNAQIAARSRSRSTADLLAALPLRSDAARAILRESGLDPEARFTMARPGRAGGLLGSQTKDMPCLDFDVAHPLVDYFMADCIGQLLSHGRPADAVAHYLKDKHALLSHDRLNQRFEMSFDVAVDPFSDGLFSEALKEAVAHMSAEDAQFWRDGTAKIGLPEVEISTQISTASDRRGTLSFPVMIRAKSTSYRATKGLLVNFALERPGGLQLRKYWVTRTPLAVARYDGNVTTLLSGRLDDFFDIENPHHRPLRLTPQQIKFSTFINIESSRIEMQFVARRLLEPVISQARLQAYQMTEPELARERLHRTLVGILPLGTCVEAISGRAARAAQFFCAMDVLRLIPVAGAGIRAAGSVARVGSSLSGPQLEKLVITLARGTIGRDDAAQTVAAVLNGGMPVLDFARQAAHWLNPLDGLAAGFSWLRAGLGRGGELMRQHLHTLPGMGRLAAAFERSSAESKLFYAEGGIWHAAPEAVIVRNDRKYLLLDDKEYTVIDMGSRRNILALRHGADLRLANPNSGLPYGPPLSADSATRIEAQPGLSGLCRARAKRADEPEAGCDMLVQLPQFGSHAYRVGGRPVFPAFHARTQAEQGPGIHLVKIDLNFNALSSEGFHANRRIKDAPYFAFDRKVWKAVSNRLQQTSIVCTFPDRLEAQLVHMREAVDVPGGNDGTYLAVTLELPSIPGDLNVYSNRFTVPFASYPGFDGKHHGMTLIANTPYKFRLSGDWMVRPVHGQRIRLEKPAPEDIEMFNHYQTLNKFELPKIFVLGSVRQLKLTDDAIRRRFDMVLRRAEELLAAADSALIAYGSDANAVMARFTPSTWSAERVIKFRLAMKENLTKLRSALPMLKRHKYEVIGLGNAKPVKLMKPGQEAVRMYNDAVAYRGSMELDMDLSHINKPLIMFDEEHFLNAELEALAADLIHELTHARLSSRDKMSMTANEDVYPSHANQQIDIAPLLAAAARHNSDSANHAATIEQIVMALAYTQSEETLGLLDLLLDGGTRFAYKEEVAAANGCFGRPGCVVSR